MTATPPLDESTPRGRGPLVVGLAVTAVAVVAVAAGVFLVVTRDAAEPELQLSETSTSAGPGEALGPDRLDGTWTVVAGTGDDQTVAGYRIQEVFVAGARRATAVGRTNEVTGRLSVADGQVTAATVTVDTTTLASDQKRRDRALATRGLQTDEYPEATFELTDPVALPALNEGADLEVLVTGELTLHGQTRDVEVLLTMRVVGDVVTLAGAVPVELDDYDIEPPDVDGLLTVDGIGTVEFLVNFQRD